MTNKLVEVKIENLDGALYVSSRDVAEGLGKEHKNVMRDLDKIVKNGGGSDLSIPTNIVKSTYIHPQNKQEYKEYLLTKDGFTLYMFNVQGYNEFKMAYINKFNEMEKELQQIQVASYMIADPIERAKKWIEEETIRQEQAKLLENQKPKVEVYDTFIEKEHTLGFRELKKEIISATELNIKEEKFKEVLRELNLITSKKVKATSYAVRNGYAVTKDVDTNTGTRTQDRFTMSARDLVLDYINENDIDLE